MRLRLLTKLSSNSTPPSVTGAVAVQRFTTGVIHESKPERRKGSTKFMFQKNCAPPIAHAGSLAEGPREALHAAKKLSKGEGLR